MGFAAKHLSEADRERIARGLYTVTSAEEHKGELHGLCPIHGESRPSFSYNFKTDTYNCFACGASGDLVKLFCEVRGLGRKEGFTAFCEEHGIEHGRDGERGEGRRQGAGAKPDKGDAGGKDEPGPDAARAMESLEEAWEKFPPLPEDWQDRLEKIRGWSRRTMEILDLRMQTYYLGKKGGLVKVRKPERIAIPVRDLSGRLVNIRLYKPGAAEFKILSWAKSTGRAALFPARPLSPTGPVLLCEGESDTLCALSHGFEGAITQTSKLRRWPEEHAAAFRNRDVVIAYDADQPGQRYAEFAAEAIKPVAASVRLLNWPDFMGRQKDGTWPKNHGEDLTDFFVKHGKSPEDLQALIDVAPLYVSPQHAPASGVAAEGDILQFYSFGVNKRFSFKPRLLAEKLLEDLKLLLDPTTGLLYQWNGKWWEVYDEEHIKALAIKALGSEAQKSRIEDACFQVKMLSTIPPGRTTNDRKEWICLQNGMLNLYTFELRSHDPDFYATYALPVAFDPESPRRCELWERYLDTNIQTPAVIAQVQEFAGYILVPHTKFEKCLFLLGPGRDGKSTFMKIMKAIVGDENCAAVSFPDLENEFHRSSLYNRLLNISTEIGGQAIESPYFKAITSGDPISAAFKHRDNFTFSPYVKLIFAGNILPKVRDNSDAFFERLLIVNFKRQFLEGDPERDPDLFEKLYEERSEIFYWQLCGLKRLTEQRRFTDCEESRSLMMGYRRSNNPVLCFVEDECLIGESYEVAKSELYADYRKYCGENGYMAVHKENFYRELYTAIHNLKMYRPRTEGNRSYYIRGIGKRMPPVCTVEGRG